MSEVNKKFTRFNTNAIDILVKKYGFGKDYIRKSIRGDRTGATPIRIQEEYKVLCKKTDAALQKLINSDIN